MILQTIIDEVIKNKDYKTTCIKIAGSKDLGDELYQNFFLSLYSVKEEQFSKAIEKGYLKFLLIRIIQNINLQRYSKYCNENNGMLLLTNLHHNIIPERLSIKKEDTNPTFYKYTVSNTAPIEAEILIQQDERKDKKVEMFLDELERQKQSPENRDELADCLFMEAYIKYGKLSEVARKSGINYQTCKKRLNKLRQKYNGN